MFKVQDNVLEFYDWKIYLPDEYSGLIAKSVYGTCTHGLESRTGYVNKIEDNKVGVMTQFGQIYCQNIDTELPNITDNVCVREQLSLENGEQFWLVSKKKITDLLNWITVEYKNGKRLRICPFTFEYKEF